MRNALSGDPSRTMRLAHQFYLQTLSSPTKKATTGNIAAVRKILNRHRLFSTLPWEMLLLGGSALTGLALKKIGLRRSHLRAWHMAWQVDFHPN